MSISFLVQVGSDPRSLDMRCEVDFDIHLAIPQKSYWKGYLSRRLPRLINRNVVSQSDALQTHRVRLPQMSE